MAGKGTRGRRSSAQAVIDALCKEGLTHVSVLLSFLLYGAVVTVGGGAKPPPCARPPEPSSVQTIIKAFTTKSMVAKAMAAANLPIAWKPAKPAHTPTTIRNKRFAPTKMNQKRDRNECSAFQTRIRQAMKHAPFARAHLAAALAQIEDEARKLERHDGEEPKADRRGVVAKLRRAHVDPFA